MPGSASSLAASLLLLVIALHHQSADAVEVRNLRVWASPESTRVVLELDGRTDHNLFTLRDPDRIVVDIPAARLAASASPPAGQGLVRQIRVGSRDDGSLRVVLDVSGSVQPKSFVAEPNDSYGYRLVVDLAQPSATASATPVIVQHAPVGETRDLVIAVDAGHGGDDPGAIGRSGTREKDVVLAIARALAARIDREPGMRSLLIRDGDYYLSHRERTRKARLRNADLFVSIHADSIRDRRISGSSVYILSPRGASDEAARWLAERENASDLIGGVSLDNKDNVLASVLLDLSQTASLTASMTAAERVLHELDRVGEVRKRNVQQAGFLVLKSPDVPSLLVETAYISNPEEERRLRDQRQQERLAEAIHTGIRTYFYDNPPPGTRIAALAANRPKDSGRKVIASEDDGRVLSSR